MRGPGSVPGGGSISVLSGSFVNDRQGGNALAFGRQVGGEEGLGRGGREWRGWEGEQVWCSVVGVISTSGR